MPGDTAFARTPRAAYSIASEIVDRGMPEAILILGRIELPIIERPLFRRDRERTELGHVIAEPNRALAEIIVDERMAERMAIEIQRRALRSADCIQHLVMLRAIDAAALLTPFGIGTVSPIFFACARNPAAVPAGNVVPLASTKSWVGAS